MASQINKYAQNIARARYATPTIPATGVRTGAKISVAGAPAAKGGAPAAKVPTGVEPGEPTAPEYNPIIDAETMSPPVDPNRQETIVNQARAPRFAIGNPNVGNIDLGSLLSSKANVAYDPNAPVGGANVPFQETKGVGGFFRRMFGDTANEQNVAAQQQQAAEWKAEGALAKQRQAKREDLEHEVGVRTEAERGLKKEERTFTAEQNKALRDFNAAESALDRALRLSEGTADRTTRVELARADRDAAGARLDKELGARSTEAAADRAFRSSEGAAERGFRAGESQADRAARLAEGEANRALTAAHYGLQREEGAADRELRKSENAADRELRKTEGAAGRSLEEARFGLQREGQASEIRYKQRPRFERLGDNVYTNEKGEIFEYSPGMPDLKTGKPMPGGFRKVPTPGVMAPRGAGGGGNMQVDRATGKPISAAGQLPSGGGVMARGGTVEPVNTALFPTMGRALGETAGEAVSTVTDPLRAMGTEAYKALFSSGAQQDPEVLKRIKEREARRTTTQPRFNVPLGF